ncbi:MAG TPA: NnrS family protein [Acetobacteraceae bacterium]|nr:NnrS family protein [Acetobacteraceae bacterium]
MTLSRTGLRSMPFLATGFRPFFLAAASWSAVALILWMAVLAGAIELPSRFDPLSWHIHEMLFGFVLAGIGGFLLTAVPNWTGRAPVAGLPLALLLALWMAGRAACLVSAMLPAWLGVAVDLSFAVALEAVIARELFAAGNRRNYPLLAPLAVLIVANLLMHLQAVGLARTGDLGWRLGVAGVLVLISVIGGRIVPAFTRNWLGSRGVVATMPERVALDRVALGVLHAGLFAWVFLPAVPAVGVLLLAGAALQFWRLARWGGVATTGNVLLAVLHVGYLWLPVGIGLLGLSLLVPAAPPAAAIHALTGGAFGTMLLAVMTRATLGHTGRALHADGATVAIYALVTAAALLRIAAAWPSAPAMDLLEAAAAAWVAAFALFVAHYGPMLLGESLSHDSGTESGKGRSPPRAG